MDFVPEVWVGLRCLHPADLRGGARTWKSLFSLCLTSFRVRSASQQAERTRGYSGFYSDVSYEGAHVLMGLAGLQPGLCVTIS